MKRINLVIIICFVVSNMLLSQTKKSVAVPEFLGGNGQDAEALADLVGSRLANRNVFKVYTRTSVEAIMKEHNFQRRGLTDIENAKAIGKLVNVDYIIVGKITALGNLNIVMVQMVNVETGNVVSSGELTFKDISETFYSIENTIESIVRAESASSALDNGIAMYEGSIGISNIKILLNEGINARDSEGWTALMVASRYGYMEIVLALIEKRLNVNIKNDYGYTALHLASTGGHAQITRALIYAGASINIQSDLGYTALMYAAQYGHTEVVGALIYEGGASLNIQENDGATALYLATNEGYTEIVRALIQAGANVNIKDNNGNTPLTVASYRKYPQIEILLKRSGAW